MVTHRNVVRILMENINWNEDTDRIKHRCVSILNTQKLDQKDKSTIIDNIQQLHAKDHLMRYLYNLMIER